MFKKPNKLPAKKVVTEALNDHQKQKSESKFFRAALIAAVVLNGLTYQKVDKLEKNQTTIIVPYGAKSSDLLITGESASAEYMRMLLRLVIADYGSISKATIDSKFSSLLGLVYPDRNEAQSILSSLIRFLSSWNCCLNRQSPLQRIQRISNTPLPRRKSIVFSSVLKREKLLARKQNQQKPKKCILTTRFQKVVSGFLTFKVKI